LPGIRPMAFGHLGDGNVHFNLIQPADADPRAFLDRREALSRIVHDTAVELGGSISAEHGLGRLKRDEIRRYKPAVEIELMRRIKAALDPDDIMNPGKVV
ncbi:MAG: FAD-linked oxidase C-terminal domain-containing protein, partial [Dongiaceae bacterium]